MLIANHSHSFFFFFFNDTATTEIYTLSLHDALPIYSFSLRQTVDPLRKSCHGASVDHVSGQWRHFDGVERDRKSTRLNSSHSQISYAVFCLKKKKKNDDTLILCIIMSVRDTRAVITG